MGDPFEAIRIPIKEVPPAIGIPHRQFIRFLVERYPEIDSQDQLMPYAGQWAFRMDMMIGNVRHTFQWHQPPQESEPSPDPDFFARGLESMSKALHGLRSPPPSV